MAFRTRRFIEQIVVAHFSVFVSVAETTFKEIKWHNQLRSKKY
jgi:hypothetical protein